MDYLLGLGLVPHLAAHWTIDVVAVGVIVTVVLLLFVVIKTKHLDLGPLEVVIPALIIIVSMIASGCNTFEGIYALALFGTYIIARRNGNKMYLVPALCVVVGTVSLIVAQDRGGALFNNRNMAAGALILCTLLYRHWLLATVAIIGLFFTGAEQALVGIAALMLVLLLKKDWSRKLAIPVVVLSIAVVCTPQNITKQLWTEPLTRVEAAVDGEYDTVLDGRLEHYYEATRDIKLFGHGYAPLNYNPNTAHNVPLRVLYEVGPIATLAWLWLVGYALVKSRLKYVFAAIVALSIFDHYLWTSLSPFFWAALGTATVSSNTDNIFRKEVATNVQRNTSVSST